MRVSELIPELNFSWVYDLLTGVDDVLKLNTPGLWTAELEKANFPVLYPTELPDDLRWVETTWRSEDPNREYPRSSLKIVLEDHGSGKKLSIKEFHYDWAPAAYDCPSLWKNYIKFAKDDLPEPRPFLVGNDVLWIGVNYRNQRAASIIKDRTTVEMVVLNGEVSDQEFLQIAGNLRPVKPEQRDRLLKKNFAETSYGYPKAVPAIHVPFSFWKFPLTDSKIEFQTAFTPERAPEAAIQAHLPVPGDCGYKLDSVFAYHAGDLPSEDSRYCFVYEHEEKKGSTIHLVHAREGSPVACSFPPCPDTTQKFKTESTWIRGVECHYAYRSETYGPHELIFKWNGFVYLVLVKPAAWTSREWFFGFMEKFLP